MKIIDVINRFNTTPFLFVGSGMTRRYLGLPDWKGLLTYFAQEIKSDPFAYSAYENLAKKMENPEGVLPKVATLIQRDYDEKWFSGELHRTVDEDMQQKIMDGLSPFKAEVATYINRKAHICERYQNEIRKLSEISEKSISGVITTNYDTFLEDHFAGFKKYVGQSQLIFSAIQGIAEIYKIHGSVEEPDSIVINEADYQNFDSKRAYLASKLMTIFMEYPIIFLGYSISDSNIQSILKSIVNCLETEQAKQLEDRFVFVEYDETAEKAVVSPYMIMIEGKPLSMTKITLSDFFPLFEAIGTKETRLPVRILRKFKQELYTFVITNEPTATLHVASIEDKRVSDDDLVLAVGRADQFSLHGLNGINGDDWYRDIVLGDLAFSADDLLTYAYERLNKQNSNCLPINKYLSQASKHYPEWESVAKSQTLDSFIPRSILKGRGTGKYHSVTEVWTNEKNSLERATRLISQLKEEEFDVTELEGVLRDLFQNKDCLLQLTSANKSQVRRLIRIYDFLKWGNKTKELPD